MHNSEKPEEVYKKYSTTVYKYLYCLTKNEHTAEELTQETFAIALEKIKDFKYKCKLSTWLCQIAKHLWYKQLKENKRKKSIPFEELENEIFVGTTVDDIVCDNDEKINLYKQIQNLDENSRNVIYLKLSGNLSFVEIAAILGKTPSWVRVTYFRAKEKLKKEGEKWKKKLTVKSLKTYSYHT